MLQLILIKKGVLAVKRQAMVDKAFLRFDRDGSGTISAVELKWGYNAAFHPKVQKGESSEEAVF